MVKNKKKLSLLKKSSKESFRKAASIWKNSMQTKSSKFYTIWSTRNSEAETKLTMQKKWMTSEMFTLKINPKMWR
jgi:hypothetical protein